MMNLGEISEAEGDWRAEARLHRADGPERWHGLTLNRIEIILVWVSRLPTVEEERCLVSFLNFF